MLVKGTTGRHSLFNTNQGSISFATRPHMTVTVLYNYSWSIDVSMKNIYISYVRIFNRSSDNPCIYHEVSNLVGVVVNIENV